MNDHGFRLFKAISYIDRNLFAKIDLDSIASAGAFSPFHFHRVFTSLMGISVGDYVRKRRLGEAARRLIYTDQNILDLAIECQYESQEAFTRAFKKMYDIPPGQLRKMKKSIELERSLTLEDINDLIKGDFVKPEIIEQAKRRIIGIAMPYSTYDFQKAHQQWENFYFRLSEIADRDASAVLGVGLESLPGVKKSEVDRYIYVAGVEVGNQQSIPEGMTEIIFPAAKYAQFTHIGPIAEYGNTARKIWNNWLPESGLKVLEITIEVYGEKFTSESPTSELYIQIPIK